MSIATDRKNLPKLVVSGVNALATKVAATQTKPALYVKGRWQTDSAWVLKDRREAGSPPL
jgi:hypothetical protein